MSNRISIRKSVVGLGLAATVAAGTVGLNITGGMGDLTASEAQETGRDVTTTAAFSRDAAAEQADGAQAKKKAKANVTRARVTAAKKAAVKRQKAKAAKAAEAARVTREPASRSTARSYSGDPRGIARSMAAARYGWGAPQFSCLDSLWEKESGWNYRAENSSSGAYGIPQALPGSKMASQGSDWRTNPATQIAWGLSYIDQTYGSPCSAMSTSQGQGWY